MKKFLAILVLGLLLNGCADLRKTIAKKGKKKYIKYFNSTVVADYIIKNTFDIAYKKNQFMWENK